MDPCGVRDEDTLSDDQFGWAFVPNKLVPATVTAQLPSSAVVTFEKDTESVFKGALWWPVCGA